MNKKKVKISYDRRSKVLSLEVGRGKSTDSDVQGNMVLDYDKSGKVLRINLYEFSFDDFKESRKTLGNFSKYSRAPMVLG